MSRRAVSLALSVMVTCGFGMVADLKAAEKEEPAASDAKTMSVELVSTNAEAKNITVKKLTAETTEPETLAVEGKALASLNDVKSGDKVTLTCKEGSGGEGGTTCVVTEIAKTPDQE